MADPPRAIELNEDMPFQQRTWAVERVGWAIMALWLFAAVLGLFGAGPLSDTVVLVPQTFARVEYDRFQRQSAPAVVKVVVAETATESGELVIAVDDEFLRAYDIRSIRPEPAQSVALGYGVRFRLETTPQMPATIYFQVQTARMGFFRPRLTIAGGPAVELPILIYP